MKHQLKIAALAITILCAGAATAQKAEKKVAKKNESVYRLSYLEEGEAAPKNGIADLIEIYETRYDTLDTVNLVSYAYGQGLAGNLKTQGFTELDLGALCLGLIDVMHNRETQMNEIEGQQLLNTYIQKIMEEKSKAAKAAGEKWLADNGAKENVVTTESGLQYEVLRDADGPKPTATTKVTVHYHGTLTNGDVFDSSVERGQPATFPLNQVIKGWTEGLQYMTVGSKFRFYIPSDLGYGPRGAGGKIGPNEVLVFEVELLSME